MQSLKLYVLCNRIAISSLNRKFQTYSVLLARKGKGPRIPKDPGIRHQKALNEEDPEFLQQLENEEDVEVEEPDFTNVDAAYEEHFQEKRRKKDILQKLIIKQKFFAPAQQPLMLTCSEKETIKFLHQKDPDQWDVRTLSENFPATPDIIKKVLKSNYKISPERQMKMDEKVVRNWELLEEGKLDADPNVIKHLKKFVNHRQDILEQVKKKEFYLPEVKKEQVWNNAEMNNIISHYERLIQKFDEERDKELVSDELNNKKNVQISDANKKKSYLDILHEKVDEKRKFINVEGKESFTLGKMFKAYQKEMTFEELQSEIFNKAEAKKKLHLTEKAILESNLGVDNYNKSEGAISDRVSSGNIKTEENEESTDDGIKNRTLPSKLFEKETREINDESECNIDRDKKEEERLRKKYFISMEENQDIPPPNENTYLVNERDIGKVLNRIKEPEENLAKEDEIDNEHLKKSVNVESEREIGEQLYCEKEEQDIKITPIWNNTRDKKEDERLRKKLIFLSMEESKCIPPHGENTQLVSVKDIGKILDRTKEPEENLSKLDEVDENVKQSELESEREMKERLYYEKEVQDIKNTPFWNNERTSKDKALAEFEKKPLGAPKDKLTGVDVSCHDFYPERIEIPKSKRGSGLTFKVKDCYYDDDGEFLYRVPGMTK